LADERRQILTDTPETSSIQHIIVSLIESGLSVFYETLSGDPVDPDLFSALFTAASLVRKVEGSGSSDYEVYNLEDQMAHICYGDQLAGIAVANGPIGEKAIGQLKLFVNAYEAEYGILLTNWDGDRSFFDHDWASRLLQEYVGPAKRLFRLHNQAMARTNNALQIRLVLLIKRYIQTNAFELQTLLPHLVDELIIPREAAENYLFELETSGIIVPS
jgi:hypothetical protein